MAERLLAVSVGRARRMPSGDRLITSGIGKGPVEGPVVLTAGGLEGDEQADLSVHGGEHRAAYVYSRDDYDWWEEQLDRSLPAGQFGENLMVTGLRGATVRSGDVLRIGGAVVGATIPRVPCAKLGARMGDPGFIKRFRDAARPGFYLRVLEEGPVAAGDRIERLEPAPEEHPTMAELYTLHIAGSPDPDALSRVATVADLPQTWRDWIGRRLQEAGRA
jgi:MOSC domain-containing protein YiiM